MLKLITDIHPALQGFVDAVSRKNSGRPYVTRSAEWRALSRCYGRVANTGYILRNECTVRFAKSYRFAIIHSWMFTSVGLLPGVTVRLRLFNWDIGADRVVLAPKR
jgi:hypothetical protein